MLPKSITASNFKKLSYFYFFYFKLIVDPKYALKWIVKDRQQQVTAEEKISKGNSWQSVRSLKHLSWSQALRQGFVGKPQSRELMGNYISLPQTHTHSQTAALPWKPCH